jgi:hypothetical protein
VCDQRVSHIELRAQGMIVYFIFEAGAPCFFQDGDYYDGPQLQSCCFHGLSKELNADARCHRCVAIIRKLFLIGEQGGKGPLFSGAKG